MEDTIVLAPAGSREQVTAAVRCGADAVYLGAKNFNARRNAANFDDPALADTVAWCHARGAKVFVTVNTLVMDGEWRELEEEADRIAEAGADAVIIQDPGVMRLFRDRYPGLPRHASTQTVVHNLEGAKLLEDMGYDTVLLARELTLREMEKICSGIHARAEAFVHGAHCMSVSGACYLSGMLGGRSGNRGLCAQPCRLDWRCAGRDHALSLKDMSLLAHIRSMRDAGVGTFKIEGRMKRPEYVAAVVTACRRALAGEPYDQETLRAVFSRSGFTDGYLTGRRDGDMFGYRTREDVAGAEKVLGSLAALYRNETPRVKVSMAFALDPAGACLTVSDGERTVKAWGPAPETAVNRPLDGKAAEQSLGKTGGTPFFAGSVSSKIAPGLAMPVSALNALRRQALEELLARRGERRPWPRTPGDTPAPEPRKNRGEPALWARFARPEQAGGEGDWARVILPVERIGPRELQRFGARLTGELPALVWPEDEEDLARRLEALWDAGLRDLLTENLYGLRLGRRLGFTVRGGGGLNVLNTRALEEYQALGLASVTASWELAMARIKALGGTIPLGAVVYGRLPLMRFRACPVRAAMGCNRCRGRGELTDRRGVVFPVECSGKKYSTLLNSVPVHLAQKNLRGLDFGILYFTRESREECLRVTEDYRLGRGGAGEHTGGLYYRQLL